MLHQLVTMKQSGGNGVVPIILLNLSFFVSESTEKQCGLVGTDQMDPFGLVAQLSGNFVPPVPVPPLKRLSVPQATLTRNPDSLESFSAFRQIMSMLQPGPSLSFIGRKKRQLGETTPADEEKRRKKRIVGGYDAIPGQLCWQVKVQVGNAHDETICGGTIIGSQTILIAAHCVFDSNTRRRIPDQQVTVIVGGMNRDVGEIFGFDSTGCAEQFQIDRSIVHPAYSYDLNDNDIGILILSRRINIDQKLCACTACLSNRSPQPLEWCVVSGYGEESSDGQSDRGPVPLKWTQLQIRPQDYSGSCAFNTMRSSDNRRLLHTDLDLFVCAGAQPWEDTCQGDSGGPLICLDPVKRSYYQAGIVSFGDDCGAGVGGQYTKVSRYIPWIIANSLPSDVILN